MNISVKKKFIERCQQLIEEGEKLKETNQTIQTFPDSEQYVNLVNRELFYKWKNNSENLIVKISNTDSSYYRDFHGHVNQGYYQDFDGCLDQVIAGMGILRGIKEDLEQGFLERIQDLIVSNVFTNFLDQAKYLLNNGYKDAAASIAGAVLEDSLKKIAKKNNIPIQKQNGREDGIGSLNNKLSQQQIYNELKKRTIHAWKEIRDNASHGKFDEYSVNDVKTMIDGVGNFLSEYF